jgi:protein TonB
VAASPSPARAQSKPIAGPRASPSSAPRVEFVAVSSDDSLLEQVGQALDGESVIRQVDTVDAARDLIRATPCCVVLLEVPAQGNAAQLVKRLDAHSELTVIVVFAPTAETATVARAITATATFAVLPIPLEVAKTAAVLEGARDEAASRHTLLTQRAMAEAAATAQPDPAAHPAPSDPARGDTQAFAPAMPGPRTARGETAATDLAVAEPDKLRGEPPRDRRKPLVIGALLALVAVGAGATWYLTRDAKTESAASAREETTPPAVGVAPADVAAPAVTAPVATNDAETAIKSGAVEDLLDLARTAFSERRYTDPKAESALVYYRSVLAQEPDNGEAREGLARIVVVLDERLQAALNDDRYDDAALALAQLKLANADPARLKDAEGKVAAAQIATAIDRDNPERAAALLRQAETSRALKGDQVARLRADIERQQADTRVKRLIGEIDTRIRDGRLVEPANDSAKYYVGQLRKLPNGAQAGNSQQRVLENAVLDQARAAGVRKQNDELERWLGEARKLGVSSSRITAVRREARPTAAAAPAAASDVGRLAALVQTRINEGRLLEPAQDSALYQLGQLRTVDVAGTQYSTSARALSDRLLERGHGAVGERKPDVAQNYAAAARQVGVNEAGVAALEGEIAQLRAADETPRVSNDQVKRTRYVAPEYPRDAMLRSIEGSVKVRFTIDSDGKVSEALVVSSTGNHVFDKAALSAVRRWRFEPLSVAGEPAQATLETTVVFKLADDAAK